jgi:hypothetical protein
MESGLERVKVRGGKRSRERIARVRYRWRGAR